MQKLENFLKEKFPASSGKKSHGSQLAEAMIGKSLGGLSFDVPEAFDLAVSASVEELKTVITQFYLDLGNYVISADKNLKLRHFGVDLSFENDENKLFVVISPFETFFKISVTLIFKR